MNTRELDLPGVVLLARDVFVDLRGHLVEVHRAPRYAALGLPEAFAQTNHSRSARGTIRGLHWQEGAPQGKLVTVIRGRVLDVVADARPDSSTYGQHVAVELADDGAQLWIPPGYAHGFCVISGVADVLYGLTDVYRPDAQAGVRWDDPELDIDWPVDAPILSEKDAALPTLAALRG